MCKNTLSLSTYLFVKKKRKVVVALTVETMPMNVLKEKLSLCQVFLLFLTM